MKTTFSLLFLSAALLLSACRARESMASKSAKAFEEAVRTGVPIGDDGHGGHAPPTAPDHAAMGHAPPAPAADHAAMGHAPERHDTPDHASMRHQAEPAPDQHAAHAAPQQPAPMDHAAMGHDAMPPATTGDQRVFPISEAPSRSREMAQLRPSSTLAPDPQDAPAPSAVSEANKAGQATGDPHAGHQKPPGSGR